MQFETHEEAVTEWDRVKRLDHPLVHSFLKFCEEHPEVWGMFVHYATEARTRRKYKVIGVDVIRGRVRWETFLYHGDRRYKIANDYSPLIARRLQADDPNLVGLFRMHRNWPDS